VNTPGAIWSGPAAHPQASAFHFPLVSNRWRGIVPLEQSTGIQSRRAGLFVRGQSTELYPSTCGAGGARRLAEGLSLSRLERLRPPGSRRSGIDDAASEVGETLIIHVFRWCRSSRCSREAARRQVSHGFRRGRTRPVKRLGADAVVDSRHDMAGAASVRPTGSMRCWRSQARHTRRCMTPCDPGRVLSRGSRPEPSRDGVAISATTPSGGRSSSALRFASGNSNGPLEFPPRTPALELLRPGWLVADDRDAIGAWVRARLLGNATPPGRRGQCNARVCLRLRAQTASTCGAN